MKRIGLALVLLSGLAATPGGEPPGGDPRVGMEAHCRAKWPDDPEMVDRCIERQGDAARRLHDALEGTPAGRPDARMVTRCLETWKDGDAIDFERVYACYKKRLERWRALE